MERSNCPSSGDLRALIAGELSEDLYASATQHVDQCPTCQQTAVLLAEEAHVADRNVCGGVAGDFEPEAECRQAVQQIKALRNPDGAETLPIADATWEREEPPSDDAMPERLGRYELVRLIGRGGMGAVYLANDEALDRHVAVKVPEFGGSPRLAREAVERFQREARAMATVRHNNLCPIFDVGVDDGQPYLTMAYIEGETLTQQIEASGPMDGPSAARLVQTLAVAIEGVHRAGIVHRDLKPSNVMIDAESQPIITDFGLASRGRAGEAELTQTGAVLGSPAYMAPEQVRGQLDQIGPHTDVYALGGILYFLLSGKRPHEGASAEVLGKVVSNVPTDTFV